MCFLGVLFDISLDLKKLLEKLHCLGIGSLTINNLCVINIESSPLLQYYIMRGLAFIMSQLNSLCGLVFIQKLIQSKQIQLPEQGLIFAFC